jgi:hypothetical protein
MNEFLTDNFNTGRFILSIGIKGGGKTYLMNNFLKLALLTEKYESYHLVIPMYKHEANDSYNFIPNSNQIKIYNGYSEKVSEIVIKERLNKHTCFMIDDASGELLQNLDTTLMKLITTTRHGKGCTLWINVHSAKKILSPLIRQNIDYLFVYRLTNRKLLQDIYDEWLSFKFDDYRQFCDYYLKAMQQKNNAFMFSIHLPDIDNDVYNWEINKESDNMTNMMKLKKFPQKKKEHERKIKFNHKIKLSKRYI